jgi:hypothetical protein
MRFSIKQLAACGAALFSLSTTASAIPVSSEDVVVRSAAEARQLPASAYFNLKAPSHDLFRNKALQDGTVLQGFAFDNKNRRLFTVQLKNGSPEKAGDLAITQLDFSGKKLGYMYLKGFGHGVAIAAEAVGTSTYLWTEASVNKDSGYGLKLARFKFQNGKTITSTSAGVQTFKPFAGGSSYTCVINPTDSTLVVRYQLSGAKHIAAFPLAQAAKGDFSKPLVNFKQPVIKGKSDVFQGYAAYGQYLYVLTGTSYTASGNKVNSEVTSVDMNTGKIQQGPLLTKAGESLSYREPEGMAIYTTAAGEPRLFLGFASGLTGGQRRANIFYKNELVKKK